LGVVDEHGRAEAEVRGQRLSLAVLRQHRSVAHHPEFVAVATTGPAEDTQHVVVSHATHSSTVPGPPRPRSGGPRGRNGGRGAPGRNRGTPSLRTRAGYSAAGRRLRTARTTPAPAATATAAAVPSAAAGTSEPVLARPPVRSPVAPR